MHVRYLIAQLQTQILLLAAAGLKEYEADWLKNAKSVTRDGSGKFASKGSSNTAKTDESSKETSQKDIKAVLAKVDKVTAAIDKLSTKEQDSLKDGINAPNMKKAREEVGGMFDNAFGEKIGEIYRDANAKIEAEINKQSSLSKAFKKAKEIATNVIEGAKEDPSLVSCAALGALAATIGVAAMVATVSIPNIIGIGGLFGGIAAIATGQTGAAITGAFVTGGLSQLGFGLSLYAVAGGMSCLLTSTFALANKEFRKSLQEAKQEMQRMQQEAQKMQKDNCRALVKQGYATPDGLATPKYIKLLKDYGYLNENYPENKPYKIPQWIAV